MIRFESYRRCHVYIKPVDGSSRSTVKPGTMVRHLNRTDVVGLVVSVQADEQLTVMWS